jgi:hypothetical protein
MNDRISTPGFVCDLVLRIRDFEAPWMAAGLKPSN